MHIINLKERYKVLLRNNSLQWSSFCCLMSLWTPCQGPESAAWPDCPCPAQGLPARIMSDPWGCQPSDATAGPVPSSLEPCPACPWAPLSPHPGLASAHHCLQGCARSRGWGYPGAPLLMSGAMDGVCQLSPSSCYLGSHHCAPLFGCTEDMTIKFQIYYWAARKLQIAIIDSNDTISLVKLTE